MKILFLTPRFPYPVLKGEQLRAYNFIKYLSNAGHEVYLLSFCDKNDLKSIHELERYCKKVICVKVGLFTKILNFLKCLFFGYPIQIFPFFSKKMENEIKEITSKVKFDIVQIELVRMAHFADLIKNVPIVIDLVDCLALNMERRYKTESLLKKLAFYFEWRRISKYEKEILMKNYNFLVVSNSEKKAFLNNSKIKVLALGVPLFCNSFVKEKTKNRIILSGTMSYYPNIKAACYFAKEIFPKIKAKFPDVQFHIIGANPHYKVKRLHDCKNIFVRGYVENMLKEISFSQVAVAPLIAGTGIQIKVLEAMACKVPVVATSYAIQGIDCENGKDILVSDDPQEFADMVIELMQNEEKRNKIVENAYQLVREKYNWEKIVEELLKLYDSMISV